MKYLINKRQAPLSPLTIEWINIFNNQYSLLLLFLLPVLMDFHEYLSRWDLRFKFNAHHIGANNLPVKWIYFFGWWSKPVLCHCRYNFIHISCYCLGCEVINAGWVKFKRFGHRQNSEVMCVLHFLVFLSCQETKVTREMHDLLSIFNEGSVNDIHVSI